VTTAKIGAKLAYIAF